MQTATFTQDDYQIIKRDVVYNGVFRMVRNHLRHRKFNGAWTDTFVREIMERRSAVGVLLYDPQIDSVVLIEQFRAGAMGTRYSPWLIEIVAGIFDRDESASLVAIREAREEAGATVLGLESICGYFVSPGGSNEFIELFCAHVDASQLGGLHGLEEEHEDIRAQVVSVDTAFQMIADGKIITSPVIVSIYWLLLNRERLKTLWLK